MYGNYFFPNNQFGGVPTYGQPQAFSNVGPNALVGRQSPVNYVQQPLAANSLRTASPVVPSPAASPVPMAPVSLKLNFRQVGEQPFPLEVLPTNTIREIKERLSDGHRINGAPHEMRLIHNGVNLPDSALISNCAGLVPEAMVHVILPAQPQQTAPEPSRPSYLGDKDLATDPIDPSPWTPYVPHAGAIPKRKRPAVGKKEGTTIAEPQSSAAILNMYKQLVGLPEALLEVIEKLAVKLADIAPRLWETFSEEVETPPPAGEGEEPTTSRVLTHTGARNIVISILSEGPVLAKQVRNLIDSLIVNVEDVMKLVMPPGSARELIEMFEQLRESKLGGAEKEQGIENKAVEFLSSILTTKKVDRIAAALMNVLQNGFEGGDDDDSDDESEDKDKTSEQGIDEARFKEYIFCALGMAAVEIMEVAAPSKKPKMAWNKQRNFFYDDDEILVAPPPPPLYYGGFDF